jgi:sugar O-acyltransferase (sialic acid O-acetyltransferase NeuD family)
MIVIGAGGFAKELLEILVSEKYGLNERNLYFFDNINPKTNLFGKFKILKNYEECSGLIKSHDVHFCYGIGNPYLRKKLGSEFISLGGQCVSVVSSESSIGSFNTEIGLGTTILGNAQITNNVKIGIGCLIYMNTSITHDVEISDFVEISPGVTITGNCKIGEFTSIGANATLLPGVKIGSNCIIGAGSVVTKNVANNCMVKGVPAKAFKKSG